MAVSGKRRCMGCMSPLLEGGPCSVCGYDPAKAQLNINYLAPGAILYGRYLVGKMTSCDTEGAWYVGFDEQAGARVWVREYAPKAIIIRDYESGFLSPVPGCEAQYKALMSDFEDLCASLRRLPPGEKVLPVLDMVHANHTVYAVYRYIKMISLESFLKRSGGKLSWRHTKKLLMPLFHTVASVHNAGLIHRGLSPRTVEIDQTGTLWLSCFSIAAARTNKSELTAHLYEGYAAPEQYSLNSWQGTWTDVYALGAITYRAVMGKDPPSAQDRVYGDDLLETITGPDMADSVMAAINRALAVEVEDRTQTAEAYIADLLANEGSNTAVYTAPTPRRKNPEDYYAASDQAVRRFEKQIPGNPPPVPGDGIDLMASEPEDDLEERRRQLKERRKQRELENKKKKKKKRRPHPVLLLILSALIATSLLGMAVYWFANTYLDDLIRAVNPGESNSMKHGVDFSQDEQDAGNGKVAQFVGTIYDTIDGNAALSQTYDFVVVTGYSTEYDKGVVYEQSPKAGEPLMKEGKTRVTLYVSQGSELVEMPNVIGMKAEEAQALLKEKQISCTVFPVYANNAERDYEPGEIVDSLKKPGDMVDITRENVILYVKQENFSDVGDSNSDDEEEEERESRSRRPSSSGDTTSRREDTSPESSSSRRTVSIKESSSYAGLIRPPAS